MGDAGLSKVVPFLPSLCLGEKGEGAELLGPGAGVKEEMANHSLLSDAPPHGCPPSPALLTAPLAAGVSVFRQAHSSSAEGGWSLWP